MFALDANAAKAADVKTASIQQAGKYKGKITHAEYIENGATGSKNVSITFKTDDGQDARFFLNMVYQHDQQNTTNHKLLSAILACLKLRNTGKTAKATLEKWNSNTQQREAVEADVFPDLAGKKIGLLVQMEIDKKSTDGKARPTIYMPFDYDSEKTASEVLATPPVMKAEVLAKAVQFVLDKPLVDRRPHGAASAPATTNGYQAPAMPDAFDDDIPF